MSDDAMVVRNLSPELMFDRDKQQAAMQQDTRRVIDCIPFFQELDVLEIRLNVLKGVVDEHRITEMTTTFSGLPHEPILGDLLTTRFAEFPIKYQVLACPHPSALYLYDEHRKLNLFPDAHDAWKRETFLRDRLGHAKDWDHGDIVLVSDADEIPDPAVVKFLHTRMPFYGMRLTLQKYDYFLNAYGGPCTRSALALSGLQAQAHPFQMMRFDDSIPHYDGHGPKRADAAGWHFSYQGSVGDFQTKIESYAHHTLYETPESVRIAVELRRQLVSPNGTNLVVMPIDEAFPDYLQQTWRTKWRHMVRPWE